MKHTVTQSRLSGYWIVDIMDIRTFAPYRTWAAAMEEANDRAERDRQRASRTMRGVSTERKIFAPFTALQRAALSDHQMNLRVHAYTCPEDGSKLIPLRLWTCPRCDYTQTWAHDSEAWK